MWPYALTFGSRLPMTENSDTLRGLLHRFIDRGVPGAAAEIAADRLGDLRARRVPVLIEQRLRRHEHPRRAVAALRGALFGERGLQRMKLGAAREPFDGRHVGVADRHRQREAREHRRAVDEHGARAALAELAAVLRAGEAELLTKDFEERVVRLRRDGARLAVHAEGEELLRHAGRSVRRASARAEPLLSASVVRSSGADTARAAISSEPSLTMPRMAVSPQASISAFKWGCARVRRSGFDASARARSSGPSRKRVSGSRTTKPYESRVRRMSRSVPLETLSDRASSLMPIARPPSAIARRTRAALSTAGTGRRLPVLPAIRVLRMIRQRGREAVSARSPPSRLRHVPIAPSPLRCSETRPLEQGGGPLRSRQAPGRG